MRRDGRGRRVPDNDRGIDGEACGRTGKAAEIADGQGEKIREIIQVETNEELIAQIKKDIEIIKK